MARYSATFPAFVTSTAYKTAIVIHADTAGDWFELQEVHVTGSGSTASADVMHRVAVQRLDTTGAGTGTSQTPALLDPGSAASKMACTVNFSAEPTAYLLKEVLMGGFNQRGRFQWQQLKGSGIFIHNSIGGVKLGVKIISSAAGAVDVTAVWEEA